MKTVFKNLLAVAIVTFMSVSCSKSDPGSGSSNSNCFASQLKLEEASYEVSSNRLFLSLNITNNSTQKYTVSPTSTVKTRIKITTTDGKVFEENTQLLVTEIAAGATTTTTALASFGEGKTYKSHTIELNCQ
jgi:hypothetical protein